MSTLLMYLGYPSERRLRQPDRAELDRDMYRLFDPTYSGRHANDAKFGNVEDIFITKFGRKPHSWDELRVFWEDMERREKGLNTDPWYHTDETRAEEAEKVEDIGDAHRQALWWKEYDKEIVPKFMSGEMDNIRYRRKGDTIPKYLQRYDERFRNPTMRDDLDDEGHRRLQQLRASRYADENSPIRDRFDIRQRKYSAWDGDIKQPEPSGLFENIMSLIGVGRSPKYRESWDAQRRWDEFHGAHPDDYRELREKAYKRFMKDQDLSSGPY